MSNHQSKHRGATTLESIMVVVVIIAFAIVMLISGFKSVHSNNSLDTGSNPNYSNTESTSNNGSIINKSSSSNTSTASPDAATTKNNYQGSY
jgi:cytoskeletal protein RodZ